MAQLIVRNLEEDVVRRLKRRAGERGVSVEEEHRRILREELMGEPRQSFKDFLLTMPDAGDDAVFDRDKSVPDRASSQGLTNG